MSENYVIVMCTNCDMPVTVETQGEDQNGRATWDGATGGFCPKCEKVLVEL